MEIKKNTLTMQHMKNWIQGKDKRSNGNPRLYVIDAVHGTNIVEILNEVIDEDVNFLVCGKYYSDMFDYYGIDYMYINRDLDTNNKMEVLEFMNECTTTIVVGINFVPHDIFKKIMTLSTNKIMLIGDSSIPRFRYLEVKEDYTIDYHHHIKYMTMLLNRDAYFYNTNKLPGTSGTELLYITNRFRKGEIPNLKDYTKSCFTTEKKFVLDTDDIKEADITIVPEEFVQEYNRKYRSEVLMANDWHPLEKEIIMFDEAFICFTDGDGGDIKDGIVIESGTRARIEKIEYIDMEVTNVNITLENDGYDEANMLRISLYNKALEELMEQSPVFIRIPEIYPKISYGYVTSLELAINRTYPKVYIELPMEPRTRSIYGAVRCATEFCKIFYKDENIHY